MPSAFSKWRCLAGTWISHAQSSGRWTIGRINRLIELEGYGYWIKITSHSYKLKVQLIISRELRNFVAPSLLNAGAIGATAPNIDKNTRV